VDKAMSQQHVAVVYPALSGWRTAITSKPLCSRPGAEWHNTSAFPGPLVCVGIDAILDFWKGKRGYDEVSVEDIASSAGVARGLVHHYFGGRKEVYIALLERLGAVRGTPPAARGSQRPRA
jgi:Bacterial regulatory proteins, tetR family